MPNPFTGHLRNLAPLLLALLVLAGLGTALFRTIEVRTDMADFLPRATTPGAEFLLEELRSGAATTLLLAGVEGAPEAELARISRRMGEAMRASGRFGFVGNGGEDLAEGERELLFRNRYLLAPGLEAARFEVPALRAGMERLLDGLRSAASPLLARFGFADPVEAFFGMLRGWLGESRVESRGGAWFAAGTAAPRALLIARSNASGLDVEGQRAAASAIRDAFHAAMPGEARLLLSGPGVFSAEAASAVRADVEMIALLSGALLLGFITWRYRSPLMLGVAAVPLAAGTLAGAAAVALVFGRLHGAALGFGMTMLGVAVDYPILLVTQRRPEELLAGTARRIWPTLRLAALAAALGLTGMMASGFPGLAQLGLFGAAGLLTAVLVTRYLLPGLVPEARIAARHVPGPLARVLAGSAPLRGIMAALLLAALATIAVTGGPRPEDDLARLSPVPPAQLALDAELRGQLGAPDVRALIALRAPDEEGVLRLSERVAAALAPLLASGDLAGLDHPAKYLPSAATQRARQAMLPEAGVLRARLAEAGAGLPFRADAFAPFVADVERSRALPPLTLADLGDAPLLSARLSPLMGLRDGAWRGLAIPAGMRDAAAVRAALAPLGGAALLVEVKEEMGGVVARAASGALLWAAAGALAVVLLLGLGLRGARPALRALAPIAGALLVVLAALPLLGERLNPFHLAALLLTAGVSLDYALFLGRMRGAAPEEAARILGAVLNCTVATLLTFGLLALCRTPVLRGIGLTVTIGVAAAFLLACALAPRAGTGVWTSAAAPPQRKPAPAAPPRAP